MPARPSQSGPPWETPPRPSPLSTPSSSSLHRHHHHASPSPSHFRRACACACSFLNLAMPPLHPFPRAFPVPPQPPPRPVALPAKQPPPPSPPSRPWDGDLARLSPSETVPCCGVCRGRRGTVAPPSSDPYLVSDELQVIQQIGHRE
ncbi:hypothetical protein ZWY2020_033419 [Hordeum vulgare]|nr:hypothetical protein ZWY2020_033419 [Hordeum vulgare]